MDLPPARSGLFLEVSFLRLLRSCEEITAGDDKGRADLEDWATSPVFHHYVETLQEQLVDLQNQTGAKRVDADVLDLYQQRVAQLVPRLRPPHIPAFCAALPAHSRGVLGGAAPAAPPPPPPQANGTSAHPHSASNASEEVPGGLRQRPARAPAAALDQAGLEADTLTDEMVGLAAGLKRNAAAMEGAVRERGRLLDSAETMLDGNLHGTQRSVRESKAVRTRGARSLCLRLLVLFLVGITFAGVYMFIKLTSMAGFKTPRAPVAP